MITWNDDLEALYKEVNASRTIAMTMQINSGAGTPWGVILHTLNKTYNLLSIERRGTPEWCSYCYALKPEFHPHDSRTRALLRRLWSIVSFRTVIRVSVYTVRKP